ncbi:FAD-dependent oxidoreductase [Pseudomonas stutzeri]|uniref:flavin monoamine oxidase family protein n=1 Tax=Stutzerimonas stutzeri TaxID=316 RepID=UPI00210C7E13|nr:FAD-dependent oxidoreductase [Stutzerimonas stutzeri]MCQ4312791.1 FAD-dependent oxidoreductase [Stutzerimonas stutzeri]
MSKKPSVEAGLDSRRRQLLKLAGATAAVGGLGLKLGLANASEDSGQSNGVIDVAIIGGGLAGLTAARDLQLAGSESFVVLEARDRVGGRTLNYEVGDGNVSEVGGQWIGPGQTAVEDLARQLEVGTFPQFQEGRTVILGGDGRLEIDLEGTFGTDMNVAHKLSEMSRDVPSGAPWKSPKAAELDKLSVGDWLATQNIKPEDRSGWDAALTLTGGASPAKMGLLHYLSMINSANCDYEKLDSIKDSAQGTRFVGGSQILSTRMAEQLADKVRLKCPVRKISGWDGEVVTLHTDQGLVRARTVIVAIHPALCNQVQFEPALPAARAALQRAWPAHSPARKTAMVYRRPFWREKGLNGHIFQSNGPIIWAWDNSPPAGEIGIINAFISNANLPSDYATAKRTLAELFARAWGDEALEPVAFHDHDWRYDPWSITCVSAIHPGFWTTHGEALHPPCGNLFWSGTETADIWAGYMDGAVRSGHKSALQVLNALRQA